MTATRQRADLTFAHNVRLGRHGWLRLTPAYSVKVVQEILAEYPDRRSVLDPFSGTGTTGLVCAERGVPCDLLDINPFLVWFAGAKTAVYDPAVLGDARAAAAAIVDCAARAAAPAAPPPPIANIERWWAPGRLDALMRLRAAIDTHARPKTPVRDLLDVAFCRCVIAWSNAAFNHQSMSFKDVAPGLWDAEGAAAVIPEFRDAAILVVDGASSPVLTPARVRLADARRVPEPTGAPYDLVVTSPPYPNRMSYIRELRPYMYWLSYLTEPREAGELDWQAIGGTWGIATSRVDRWAPSGPPVAFDGFDAMLAGIAGRSRLLANYVHKYFADMQAHLHALRPRAAPGARLFYVVGNSKFYDTLVPVEHILAAQMRAAGFVDTDVRALRKRNSKKELVEYVVSAEAPQC